MVLVLLAHLPPLLLFLWGWRISRDEPGQALVFVSLWPQAREIRKVTPPPRPAQSSGDPGRRAVAPRAAPDAVVQAVPDPTAIIPPTQPAPASHSPPSIDWRAEASAAAARQAVPPADPGFTPAPKPLRKPCEKPKSSWEWNPQPKKAGIAPLPYVVLGRCVVGLGFFACSPQKPPEANSHLLDDMRDGKTSPSSVPDPDRCD